MDTELGGGSTPDLEGQLQPPPPPLPSKPNRSPKTTSANIASSSASPHSKHSDHPLSTLIEGTRTRRWGWSRWLLTSLAAIAVVMLCLEVFGITRTFEGLCAVGTEQSVDDARSGYNGDTSTTGEVDSAVSIPCDLNGTAPVIPIIHHPERHTRGKFCLENVCCFEHLDAATTHYHGIDVDGPPNAGSHFVGKFIEFNSFRDLADHVYQPHFSHLTVRPVVYPQLDVRKLAQCLQPGTVIWSTTSSLPEFFRDFFPHITVPFVLVTGDTDASAPGRFVDQLKDEKLLHWYGQNCDIDSRHYPKFTPLPLGPSQWMIGPSVLYHHQEEFLKIPKDKLAIYNSVTTVHPDRIAVTDLVREKMTSFVEIWTHQDMGTDLNVVYRRIAGYKFIFSPRGAGLDCYRTWEALLLGTIPIVHTSTLDEAFDDLPVLIIDDWNVITKEFLEAKWKEMMESGKQWKWEKLYRTYWMETFYRHRPPYETKLDKLRYSAL